MSKLNHPADQDKGGLYFEPSRIISGGQTGVDRAGLDAAIELGIAHGGWCPQGRLAEDGRIPNIYHLVEMESPTYPPRTRQNVRESDATLILYETRIGDGTKLTKQACQQARRPCLMIDVQEATAQIIRAWLARFRPATLNVAGTRESISPGVQQRAKVLLLKTMRDSDELSNRFDGTKKATMKIQP